MNQPQTELDRLLQHIDQLIAQASDEATRLDLQRLRARLDSPEMLDMARNLAGARPAKSEDLVLEFHDPLLPMVVTATGCVIATAICLFSIVYGFDSATAWVAGKQVNLWLVAVLAGAFSVGLTALSFVRSFSIRVDTEGMVSRISGARWRKLRIGGMAWPSIRSMHEREDRVLEVRASGGHVFEIPMRVVNYQILRQHLENMVRLYGDRPAT